MERLRRVMRLRPVDLGRSSFIVIHIEIGTVLVTCICFVDHDMPEVVAL